MGPLQLQQQEQQAQQATAAAPHDAERLPAQQAQQGANVDPAGGAKQAEGAGQEQSSMGSETGQQAQQEQEEGGAQEAEGLAAAGGPALELPAAPGSTHDPAAGPNPTGSIHPTAASMQAPITAQQAQQGRAAGAGGVKPTAPAAHPLLGHGAAPVPVPAGASAPMHSLPVPLPGHLGFPGLITPQQMQVLAAAAASGGMMVPPQLVLRPGLAPAQQVQQLPAPHPGGLATLSQLPQGTMLHPGSLQVGVSWRAGWPGSSAVCPRAAEHEPMHSVLSRPGAAQRRMGGHP